MANKPRSQRRHGKGACTFCGKHHRKGKKGDSCGGRGNNFQFGKGKQQ